MSLSKRIAALVLCLALAGCGFTPLHQAQNGHAISAAYAQIEVGIIPDRDGQHLRNLLIDRLYTQGRPQNARYLLHIAPLETEQTDLGIQKDATVTRTQIEITAQMTLTDRHNGNTVLTRRLRAIGGYDVLDAQYATFITRRSETDRALEELANNAITAINLYLNRKGRGT
ncbi:MAG: LPS assembly lipoprotein LptE [Alphaproteobacteria bacterium]|nr:LPS assembly lipoprotein LptE [Alphaproteobacteria bacterium]